MQAGAVFFSHLFDGKNFSAQGGKLGKLLLNCFQSFMPLAVGNLGFGCIPVAEPVLGIQFLNVGDLHPKTANFFSKNLKVIHGNRITHLQTQGVDLRQELTIAAAIRRDHRNRIC